MTASMFKIESGPENVASFAAPALLVLALVTRAFIVP